MHLVQLQDIGTAFSHFLRALSSSGTRFLELKTQFITYKEQDLRLRVSIAPDVAHAWLAEPQGCTVHSGTLHLPGDSVLLLNGTGVHFHGTVFRGVPKIN